jgi:hypothetical protein
MARQRRAELSESKRMRVAAKARADFRESI